MTSKTKGAEASARAGSAPKYTLEKLRLNCQRLFGISTSTFDGVTYGLTERYTVEEMRAYIEAWKKREVK